jgi:hypothetical protein
MLDLHLAAANLLTRMNHSPFFGFSYHSNITKSAGEVKMDLLVFQA